MFICLTCKSDEACINFTALQALEEHDFGFKCPTEGCRGTLLQIDDGIAEAIVVLNDKGYTTRDSCGGHFNSCEGTLSLYVGFAPRCCPPEGALPEGFIRIPGDATGHEGDAIFFLNNAEGADELAAAMAFREGNRTLQVFEANRLLLEWALTLPVRASESALGSTPPAEGRA